MTIFRDLVYKDAGAAQRPSSARPLSSTLDESSIEMTCGDEGDACVDPSLFLKRHLPASGLTFFPKSGHVLNLEEPALFNETVERFLALVEASRWGARDPRSVLA